MTARHGVAMKSAEKQGKIYRAGQPYFYFK